jgi:hypothetical protein
MGGWVFGVFVLIGASFYKEVLRAFRSQMSRSFGSSHRVADLLEFGSNQPPQLSGIYDALRQAQALLAGSSSM